MECFNQLLEHANEKHVQKQKVQFLKLISI